MMVALHRPVLYHEIIHALRPKSGGRYLDATVGTGGHAAGILQMSAPHGLLLGLDVDPQALQVARQTLAPFGERVILRQTSYLALRREMTRLGWQEVNGILFDLGASSIQFDTPERGFSFLRDGPLDMRFDPRSSLTAAQIVNQWSEQELAQLIYRYGEEPAARRIARAIVRARPISTTGELAAVIERVRPRRGSHHPATQTFQALRIAVNAELEALERVLPLALEALAPGGRLAVISFHSLEDRIVKEFFRRESQACLCPPRQVVCTCGHQATLTILTRKPIVPSEAEIRENPRARSAKLRVAEKIGQMGVGSERR
ncbi:MAG: 16S rRNA (cytosine(1402)-N(4))-methyltransferase RsmH [Anaerolineales bacterium]|nr:16S rRNA (cytosine(1402)-N(4))-methyltransferase RsmH [Anaerolineales bacterium]MCX7609610.1 16S rRNA (cytosine(1402)-N(4))-methyltransferase RsmH [Anaerolineales bacterium]MDW8227851.1 16S rRNA (cytosine(1402)-N(4))-methyltransferase RsmH [Anaerolineales bacterium]